MKTVKLGAICTIVIGRTPRRNEKAYWGKGNKWVSISDLKEKLINKTKEEITDHAVEKARCKLIKKGTLLLSFKLTIGKVAFAGTDLFTNEAIAALHIKDSKSLSADYLYYALKATNFKGQNQSVKGKTLNSKSLSETLIPLPPLSDQIRIAALLNKVETLIAQRKHHLQQLDTLLKSIFLQIFGNPIKNEKGWTTRSLSTIGQFVSGATPSKKRKDYWQGGFPWVSPKDMKKTEIDDSEDHISELVFKETALKRIPKGHLLIVVRGMILAHSFPVAINRSEIAINQDMKAIAPTSDIDVIYLRECLYSMKSKILSLVSTASHGTKKLDSSSIQKLFIPIPPLALQNHFAKIVEKAESLKTRYEQSLADLETLYTSLSHHAFTGTLDLSKPS